jgi:hypothetical protein
MKMKFYQRILILPVLVLLWSALVPCLASGQDSFVISETRLTNSEAESAGDEFGYGVAIDGSTLVVGAPWADDGASNSGSAHLFRHTDGNNFPQTKLTESDDPQTDDRFGNSVDISGDALVIGAYLDDINARNAGSAFVWTINEQIRLTGDSEAGNEFGYAVAISGDVVVVGAHKDDDKGRYSGSVYVFRNNGSTWIQEAKLLAGDALGGEKFGSSVAIDGDTIVVGAIYGGEGDSKSGSVYVFKYNGSDWEEEAELFVEPRGDSDKFGYSVAIEGDTIIVGAPYHSYGEDVSGAAYVFRHSDATWIEEAKLTDSGLSEDARFGNSVALSGNTVVVGAYKADALDVDNNLLLDVGSVYVFRFDGSGWPEKAILTPSDAAAGDEFGYGVAISGDIVVVGAHKDDGLDVDDNVMLDAGSAYIFTLVPENHPPVADAGENLEVEEGSPVTLDGSDSYDLDGDDLKYSWTQTDGPDVDLGTANEATLTFTAPPWSAGNEHLTFQLEVKDDSEAASTDEVKITVLQSTNGITEINSVLGSEHGPWGIDKDIYTFHGTEGKQVTVTLRAKTGGKNNHGDRATLKLKDNIRGVSFSRIDSGRLPNQISATLPATGEYQVIVAGQPRFFRGKRFLGEYTITLEGNSASLEKGPGSSAAHNKPGCSTKPDKQHPIWSWILSRFKH